jgi:hypothetical protein
MDRDLSSFRPSKLWRRMPLERRIDAAGLFWDDEHSADQQMEAVAAIATHMKFRPRSVVTLAPDRRAKYLAQLPTVTDAIAARAGELPPRAAAADDGRVPRPARDCA